LLNKRKGTAYFCDVETGEPLTAPLGGESLGHEVIESVVFTRDGKKVILLAGTRQVHHDPYGGETLLDRDEQIHIWDIPPAVPDEPERIRVWVAVRTGQDFDAQGVLRTLSFEELQTRRQRLRELGGPPIPWRKPRPWDRRRALLLTLGVSVSKVGVSHRIALVASSSSARRARAWCQGLQSLVGVHLSLSSPGGRARRASRAPSGRRNESWVIIYQGLKSLAPRARPPGERIVSGERRNRPICRAARAPNRSCKRGGRFSTDS
jgi:hypothetical protein